MSRITLIPVFLFTLIMRFYGYTVPELLNLFETNNLTLKQYTALTNAMQKKIAVDSSWDDTMASYELMDLPTDFNFNGDMLVHRFMLKQTLPFFGKTELKRRIAELDYLNNSAALNENKIMLRKMLLETLLENYFNNKVLQNRKNELELLKQFSEIAKTQYSTGKASLANLVEIDIRQSQAQNTLLTLSNMQRALRYEISSLLNLDETDWNIEYSGLSFERDQITNLNANTLLEETLNYFPPVSMRRNDIEMQDQAAGLAKLDYLPDLSLGLGYSYKPFPMPENLLTLDLEIGLPVFSFDKKEKAIEMNESLKKEAQVRFQSFQNELKNSLNKKIAGLKTGLEQVSLLEQRVLKPSEANIKTLISAYSVEKIDFEMLLNSVIMTFDLQDQYFDSMKNIYTALFDLETLTGKKYYRFE